MFRFKGILLCHWCSNIELKANGPVTHSWTTLIQPMGFLRSSFNWTNPTRSQIPHNPDDAICRGQSPRHTSEQEGTEWGSGEGNRKKQSTLSIKFQIWQLQFSFSGDLPFSVPFLWHLVHRKTSPQASLKTQLKFLLAVVCVCAFNSLCSLYYLCSFKGYFCINQYRCLFSML